jgi:lysophospholipid acyltransferase (LPLAT)-like uncharacterized protein
MTDERVTGSPTPDVPEDDGVAKAAADAKEVRRARQVVWTVRIGLFALRLLARTWRMDVRGAGGHRALRRDAKPFVFAFWHGTLLPLVWLHRGEGVSVLVSLHKDGEIIARVCEALGLRTVRGSTTRGGGRALLGLVRELEAGYEVAVTPDGPKGPRHHFAPGALMAAQRAHAPVVPIGVHCTRAWRLRSWDQFEIPKPFARVIVNYGPPTYVAGSTPREATEEVGRFEAILADATAAAVARSRG